MKAANAYRSLNDEQKQIVDNKTVDLDHTAGELIALLEPVAALDKLVGSTKTQLGCTIAILVQWSVARANSGSVPLHPNQRGPDSSDTIARRRRVPDVPVAARESPGWCVAAK